MIDLRVTSIGVYRQPQKLTYTIPQPWLSFQISGFRDLHFETPAGWSFTIREDDGPTFSFGLPGTRSYLDAGWNRENWVIMLQTDALRFSEQPNIVELRGENAWIPIPVAVHVQGRLHPLDL